jgi:branched-chain amino acid transport system substrate-binding protein
VAARIYEKLITHDKVDVPPVDSGAAASAIFKKGRKFLFMVLSPAEAYLDGFVELVARNGLKTIALIYEDTLFPRGVVKGASELARKRGLQVTFTEAYPQGTTDFSAILTRARSTTPDAFGAATRGLDAVTVTRQMKELDLSPRMYAATVGVNLPEFYKRLGPSAEFVYGASQWEPELVTLRAGGLIPIARQYPGARELVEAHHREYPGAGLSYHTAAGYAGCQVLTEAVRRTGSLDGERIRDAILELEFDTVFGAFKVDADGLQIAHRLVLFQWQDGKKVIVWPEEVAPDKPRFPTPPWSHRQ